MSSTASPSVHPTDDDAAAWRAILFSGAHTTHAFRCDPVDPAVIGAVYEDIRWAPTQMNSQPLRLTLIESAPARARLGRHLSRGNREKTLAAPLTILAAWDPAWHEHLDVLAPQKPQAAAKLDRDLPARETIGRRSALLQTGYLILGLRAHGLHAGPMTGFNAAGVDAEFHADTGWRTEVIINVGWAPSTDDDESVRPRAGRLSFADASRVY